MAAAPSIQADMRFAQASFDDPAFDPNPGFDFDDTADAELRNMEENIASLNVFHHGAASGYHPMGSQSGQSMPSFDPFPVSSGAFAPCMASSIDPNNVYADASKQAGVFTAMNGNTALPPAFPTDIVQDRPENVTERFGQVTPPNHTTPDGGRKSSTHSSQSGRLSEGRASKLDKSERARNAANQRHAKTKLERQAREARKDSGQGSGSDGSGDDGGEVKKEKYREKNRLAAAKCRAKKKTNVEGLEDTHRTLSASNNYLRREERTLRDELSMLRTAALQHTPAAPECGCRGLHEYNRRKASQLAFGLGGPMVSSPSDGTFSSTNSPVGYGSIGRTGSIPTITPEMVQLFNSPQSFSGNSNIAFAPVTSPEPLIGITTTASNDHQRGFANFLQSSSDGRPGFA